MSSVMGGINRTNSLLYLIAVREDARNAQVGAALNNRMTQVAASSKSVGKNARGAALATRNLGYVAQNASYQIADFFVMLQGGVGVGRALSTQLPQLLAGFGKMGAVFGALAAIGATVVVMLKEKNKVIRDLSVVTEEYTKAYEEAQAALFNFIETGEAGTRTLYETKAAVLALKQEDLAAVLAPPDPSAWRGFLEVWKTTFAAIGQAIYSIPGVKQIIDLLSVAAANLKMNLGELADQYREIDRVTNASKTALLSFIEPLVNAQPGTERFARALRLLRSEFNDFSGILTMPAAASPFPILDDVAARVEAVNQVFSNLYGKDPAKWPEDAKKAWEIVQMQLDDATKSMEGFVTEYGRLTELQPNGVFKDLFRESELDKQIREWDEALKGGLVTLEAANEARDALVKIDLWNDLQDVIVDVGKNFESQILDAMKSGKFAIKDFVAFALEQFAKLALARLFEPITLALANFVPSLGGTGSPSPGTGAPPIGGRMGADYLIPAPPPVSSMAVYGENMSKISGGRAAGGDSVTVNVNNYGNDEVEVTQNATDSGIEIDVLIKGTVAKGFASGDFDKVMQATFGARRLGY